MEVSGQLHAPGTLPWWTETTLPIDQQAGRSLEPVWAVWIREERIPLQGNEPVASRTELSGLGRYSGLPPHCADNSLAAARGMTCCARCWLGLSSLRLHPVARLGVTALLAECGNGP
jgi:hypothetical protein